MRICESPPSERRLAESALFLFCAAAAMLSKEVYVTTLPAFAFLYALWHRRYVLAATALALVPAYAWYRAILLGPGATYPHPEFRLTSYLRYLRVLTYTFSATPWGWVYYAGLAVASAWAIRRNHSAWRACLLLFIVMSAALVATSPTAAAVLETFQTPGTWYRAVFIIHTIALLGGAYLLGRYAGLPVQIAGLCLCLWILLPGVIRTRRYWDGRFARSEAEGHFYLAHPDRLVYSEEDASWFLPGLERLYGVTRTHYVSKNDPSGAHAKDMLRRFSTIWRHREDDEWIEDGPLYVSLQKRALERP